MHKILFFLTLILIFQITNAISLNPKDIENRIEKHRKKEFYITLIDSKGVPVKNKDVYIEQISHEFLFGCNIFHWDRTFRSGSIEEKTYRDKFSEIFNYATLPFYWGYYEPEKGKERIERLKRIASWCKEKGIKTKAHPLVWHEVVPEWANFSPEETETILEKRVKKIMTDFKDLIDYYDVINESLGTKNYNNCVANWIKKIGHDEAVKKTIKWAREIDPEAYLIVNDYNITSEFYNQIENLKKSKATPDAIGLQSHMHVGVWENYKLSEIIVRFEKLQLPIHFTELTILSGKLKTDNDWFSYKIGWFSTPEGEKKQAEELKRIYTILFSIPSVEAITWWDLTDYDAWQGAPAGLLRKDLSSKPAYEELKRLVKEVWWTKTNLITDNEGKISFKGFKGKYKLVFGNKEITFELLKNTPSNIILRLK